MTRKTFMIRKWWANLAGRTSIRTRSGCLLLSALPTASHSTPLPHSSTLRFHARVGSLVCSTGFSGSDPSQIRVTLFSRQFLVRSQWEVTYLSRFSFPSESDPIQHSVRFCQLGDAWSYDGVFLSGPQTWAPIGLRCGDRSQVIRSCGSEAFQAEPLEHHIATPGGTALAESGSNPGLGFARYPAALTRWHPMRDDTCD